MDAQRHASQRRKFAAAYSMSSLITYEPYVDSCTSILIQQLQELAASEKTVNLAHWLQYYAFDVIGSMSFGRRFGFLDAGEDKENIFDAIETRNLYSTLMGVFPSLHPWLFPLLPKTGAFGYIAGYTRRQMSEKFAQEKQPDDTNDSPDFLSRFSAIHAANPDKMSTTDIFTITQTNVGAGSDTVALTLSAALYHMAKNPSTYSRLQDELDVAANEGRISDPITFAQAQKLPYLQAVLKEALRIHPAMGLPMVRTVPEGGATLCGRFFPAGSTVGVNAWVAHRNKSVFGDDADIWRPERWLEFEKQGRGAEVERYFLAFGLGSRTCLGKNIALLEINKIVPQLVRGFEVVLGEDLMRRDVKTVNRGFVKMNDFEVKVVARKREKEEGREA
jgi:cytochrome P450